MNVTSLAVMSAQERRKQTAEENGAHAIAFPFNIIDRQEKTVAGYGSGV